MQAGLHMAAAVNHPPGVDREDILQINRRQGHAAGDHDPAVLDHTPALVYPGTGPVKARLAPHGSHILVVVRGGTPDIQLHGAAQKGNLLLDHRVKQAAAAGEDIPEIRPGDHKLAGIFRQCGCFSAGENRHLDFL